MLFPYGNEFFVFICRLYVLSQWNIKTNTIIRIVHRLNIKTLCKNNIVFQVIGWIVILILVFVLLMRKRKRQPFGCRFKSVIINFIRSFVIVDVLFGHKHQ